jgi:hypothetical protein
LKNTPPEAPREPVTLQNMRTFARTDSDGREKEVLSLYDRLIARVLAPPVAWLALKLGLSADAVTLLSVLAALASAVCLAQGSSCGGLWAALLLQFSYLLDCADGDVARARGTASLDGYLRDTMRHQLLNPLVFAGLTLHVFTRHPCYWVVLAGLLAAVLSTRIVGDLEDRVTLEGLLKRLRKRPASPQGVDAAPLPPPPSFFRQIADLLRALFLRDLAVMNGLTLAALADAVWLRPAGHAWVCVDGLLFVMAGAHVVLKGGGLALLWRRGAQARVERLAAEIERSS